MPILDSRYEKVVWAGKVFPAWTCLLNDWTDSFMRVHFVKAKNSCATIKSGCFRQDEYQWLSERRESMRTLTARRNVTRDVTYDVTSRVTGRCRVCRTAWTTKLHGHRRPVDTSVYQWHTQNSVFLRNPRQTLAFHLLCRVAVRRHVLRFCSGHVTRVVEAQVHSWATVPLTAFSPFLAL